MESKVPDYIEYLKTIRDYKEITLKRIALNLVRVETFLGKPLTQVETGSEIEKAVIEVANRRKMKWNGGHIDDGQMMRFRVALNIVTFLRWCHSERHIDRNPYTKNTFRCDKWKEAGYLKHDEIRQLLNCERMTVFEQTIIRFMLDTAIRRDELINVKMTDVDFNDRMVHIVAAKNDKPRTVPFSERTYFWLETALSMREKKSEYLFSKPDGAQLQYNDIHTLFKNIEKKVGFRIHAHKLRHSAAMLWVEAGVEQIIVAHYLGHAELKMTRRYLHMSSESLKEKQKEVYAKHRDIFAHAEK